MDSLKIVKLKRIETQKDIVELGLPAPVFTMIKRDGGRTVEIVFDSDNDKDVADSIKIIEKYMPKYKQVSTEKKTKTKFKKEMGMK